MAELAGTLSGATNYYTHLSQFYQLPSRGFLPGATFKISLQASTYDGAEQIGYEVRFFREQSDPNPCFVGTWITPSGNPFSLMSTTFGPPGTTIEWTGTAGATGCLDFLYVRVDAFAYHYPGSVNLEMAWTMQYSETGPPGPYCEFGTQLKAGQTGVTLVTQALIGAATNLISKQWVSVLVGAYLGTYIDSNDVCGELPPVLPSPDPTWLVNPGKPAIQYLYAVLWPYMCECTPGPTTPIPPAYPDWPYPPNWPAAPTYPVNPSNPCLDLTEVRQKLDQILRTTSQDFTLDTLLQRYTLPFAYHKGTRHTEIRGTGSIHISRLVGMQIEIIQRAYATQEVGGNPVYLWDQGWTSFSDDDGMIEERRLTRDAEVWMPQLAPTSTKWNYFLKDGCIVSATELEPEP